MTPTALVSPGRFGAARAALRAGTALVSALVMAGAPHAALAQGFNGTIDSSTNVVVLAPDTIAVTAPEAVIDWSVSGATPTDTTVSFLPSGNTVNFRDGVEGGVGEFTVLNRVLPNFQGAPLSAAIRLDGTVNSTVSGVQGGSVWFYSPYGIIAGAGAQFNVGSLLLTTSDIQLGPNGSLFVNQSGGNHIGLQAAVPGSFVRLEPGAVVNASNGTAGSAYVGIWSPRIEQGGSIRTDGSTALVAATSGTLTFNAGLIDLSITAGTDDANGIVHTGSTGGPASTGDTRKIAMVAVPRNTALTMLLQGSAGYDTPSTAGVTDNGAVELYAGDTSQGDGIRPDAAHLTIKSISNDVAGDISIGNFTTASRFEALATRSLTVAPAYGGPNAPGLVDFGQNANLYAGTSISLTAEAAEDIRVGQSLIAASMFRRTGANIALSVTGDATGTLSAGVISVAQGLFLDATGGPDFVSGPTDPAGAAGQGGAITLTASRGTISAQSIQAYADGVGSDGVVTGGSGTGGSVAFAVSQGGAISGSFVYTSASGEGGAGTDNTTGVPATGGNGTGGAISIADNGGILRFDTVLASAEGRGGRGADISGNATGGTVAIGITGQAQTWSNLIASASASGGGLDQATTVAGSATGRANGVSLTVAGAGSLTADYITLENNAYISAGSNQPHSATAGGIDLAVNSGGQLTVANYIRLDANADVTPETALGTLDVAPAMNGGRATVLANGGSITADLIGARANATGVAGLSVGNSARAGTASIGAANGGTITLSGQSAGLLAQAEGYGAVGPAAGNAFGGTARVFVDNGTISGATLIAASASAIGGGVNYDSTFAGNGFNATGGTAAVELLGGGGAITATDTLVYAKGEASITYDVNGLQDLPSLTTSDIIAIRGNGGTGTGGTARISVAAGTLTTGTAAIRAYGRGGASDMTTGTTAWQSGAGVGGQAQFAQAGGAVVIDTLGLTATGLGGSIVDTALSGTLASNGGNATGGAATATLSGGTLTLKNPLALAAFATGGNGMDSGTNLPGGAGGAATNATGLAELLMPLGSTAVLTTPAVSLTASAFGGTGGASASGAAGAGGAATAGTARASLADGGFAFPNGLTISANGFGGTGSVTGSGTGGLADFQLTDSLAAPATTRTISTLSLSADGNGSTATAGSTRFAAAAGRLASALNLGSLTATALGSTAPAGNGFAGSFGNVPVAVAGTVFVNTSRDIAITTLPGGGINAGGAVILNGRAISMGGPGLISGTTITVTATGGSAALGALTAAGAATFSATGALSVNNLNAGGTVTANAASVSIGSSGALTFGASSATAGDFAVTTAGSATFSTITATGAIAVNSGSNATITTANAGTALSVTSTGNTNITTANANGALTVNATGNATLGTATSGGAMAVTSGGAANITTANATGPLTVNATGTATLGAITSGAAISVTAGTADITTATATGALTVNTAGNATLGSATSGGAMSVTSGGATNIATANATGALTVNATGNATLGTATSGGAMSITTGSNADITTANATGPLTVNATGNATLGTATSGGAMSVTSGGATNVTTANATGALTVDAGGAATLGNATATGALTVTSGGLASFNGLARGVTIRVNSPDIRIGATAQLGARGVTSAIVLVNRAPAAGTALGGTTAISGWILDAAEVTRLFADQSITVQVPATATNPADLTIGALAYSYGPQSATGLSPNLGSGGTFAVTTPGRIRVIGAVAPTAFSANDQLSLTAGTLIDVVTNTGSIVLKNANGALAGVLSLTSPTVRVATTSALSALDGITSLSAASDRLGQNDGLVNPAGAFQANQLVFTVSGSTLYIQNSGVDAQFANRRGFTANAVAINGLAGATPSFAINGVINTSSGTLTGLQTYTAILVNGAIAFPGGAFNPRSTVNGCVIGVLCGLSPGQLAPPLEGLVPLIGIPAPGGQGNDALALPLVQYGEQPLLDSPPLIDEPVTGIGNDDLWLRICDAEKKCPDQGGAE